MREQTVRSPDTDSFQTPQSPQSPQSPPRERRSSLPPPSMPQRPADQYQPSVTTTRSNRSHSAVASRPPTNLTTTTTGERVFNFEKAKPKIIQEVAMANQLSNNLINALKLINTNQDRWEIVLQRDKRVQETRDKCEEAKKKIVRYARLVEDEEWIGTLLAANEDLLKALDVYDIMSVGEIPASWNTLHHEGSHYDTEPAAVSYSAPLQIEDSMSRLRIETAREEPDELEDPFADPVTPEDEYYEHRR